MRKNPQICIGETTPCIAYTYEYSQAGITDGKPNFMVS